MNNFLIVVQKIAIFYQTLFYENILTSIFRFYGGFQWKIIFNNLICNVYWEKFRMKLNMMFLLLKIAKLVLVKIELFSNLRLKNRWPT